jgi:hypothetical protein
MPRVLEADTTPSPDLDLDDLLTHTSQIHR